MSHAVADRPIVLIVEDEDAIAQALAYIVEDAGYSPLTAGDGKAALEQLDTHNVRLILTDLMMPVMTGAQLIAALHAAAAQGRPIPPIVIMSAAGSRYTAELGADATLPKPFDIAEVERLLKRFIDP